MCASAILPVTIGSSCVTSVCGSWLPCSSSTSIPARNCSRSNRLQSTPIASPTRRASSVVVLRFSVTAGLLSLLGAYVAGCARRTKPELRAWNRRCVTFGRCDAQEVVLAGGHRRGCGGRRSGAGRRSHAGVGGREQRVHHDHQHDRDGG